MKTRVNVITGFLGAGKTAYINAVLQDEKRKNEKIVVVQFEEGEAAVCPEKGVQSVILLHGLKENKTLDAAFLQALYMEHTPDRILIELNGLQDLEIIFQLFEQRYIRKNFLLENIICLVDAVSFMVFQNNLGEVFQKQLAYADHIVLNKGTALQTEALLQIEKAIKGQNKKAKIFHVGVWKDGFSENLVQEFQEASFYGRALGMKPSTVVSAAFLLFVFGYLVFSVVRGINLQGMEIDFIGFEAFQMVFISILMQAFPFMLIGVFLSALMQVFLSNETIIKCFPKKYGLGFVTAMFGGLLLPVCECAIVPMVSGLVKKGVSLPVAITFMLSAPIINPIVIFSTLYAFPGHPEITMYRVYFGLVIALAVGLVLAVFPEKNEAMLENTVLGTSCDCLYCSGYGEKEQGFCKKFRLMCLHAAEEFFSAGKYLVLGAALTSLFQLVIPNDIFLRLWNKEGLSLVVMMATAFFFSLCSTSDAFIARSFWNSFSTSSILGFLVFGPMMDIKNVLMLFGVFRKEFVLKLVVLITFIAFIMLYFMTSLLL